jgi:hypothetical protein
MLQFLLLVSNTLFLDHPYPFFVSSASVIQQHYGKPTRQAWR